MEELSEVCADLGINYGLWRQLRDPETYAEFAEVIEEHRELFDSTADAHLQSSLVAIYQVMDDRDDVLSFPNLCLAIRGTHPELVASLEARARPHQDIFSNIKNIRSKVYAHRDRHLGPDMVFAAAPISPNSLGACVDTLLSMASELNFAFGLKEHSGEFYDSVDGQARCAVDQLNRVLGALSNYALERTREG